MKVVPPKVDHDPVLAQQVLGFRRAGVTFDLIAEQLSITPEAATALFHQALSTYEPGLSSALEADRLDRLHRAVWPAAAGGDLAAVDRVIRISERREKVVADPVKNEHALRLAYDAALADSEHTRTVDEALVVAGGIVADRVDAALASGEGQELTKALYLLPHLTNVLRELLATPASRQAAGLIIAKPRGGQLATLRAVHSHEHRRPAKA